MKTRFGRFYLACGSAALSALTPVASFAQTPPPGSAQGAFAVFGLFTDRVAEIGSDLLASDIGRFGNTLFLFFAALLIFARMAQYMIRGISFPEIVETGVLIAVVQTLMLLYETLTSLLWGAAIEIGGGIQQAAIGNSDLFFVGAYIKNLVDSILVADVSILDGIRAGVAVVFLSILTALLSVLAFFAAAWAVFGYAAAKLIGWLFIPMILFQRLSFMFDGWMRFFFGFLIYAIMSRIVLSLVAVLFALYYNVPIGGVPGEPLTFPVTTFSDYFGIGVLAIISIVGLISTGKFAATIAGGVGGFGDGLRGVLRMAGRLAR